MTEQRTVKLPENLCAEAEKRRVGGFEHVEDLLIFLLAEIAKGDAIKLDQAEEAMIEQRLRDLGYI